MRTPLVFILTLAAAAIPSATGAAEFVTLEDECNGRQLMIKGSIEPGDYQRFVDRLARLVSGGDLPDVQDPEVLWTVKLDSPGGDVAEAMRIGRLLRGVLATTETSYRFARRPDGVYDFARDGELVCLDGRGRLSGCHQDLVEAECTGACLLVWLAGAVRHANEGRLGLHGLAGLEADSVQDYLAEMGVPEPWISRMLTAEPAGDGWLAWPERHKLSGRAEVMRALVAGCPARLTQEESFLSLTAASAAERNRLMNQANAHRSCRRNRLAAARGSDRARALFADADAPSREIATAAQLR
jgi:hypothetical protein